jgi:DNA-binding transcriptional regulator YhcF (GntR family)
MIQITVDNNNKTPIYRQLLEQLKDDILAGKLLPGYKLPTVRDLAASTGISAGTIKHTYDVLEQSGLIKKARGSGSFVSSTRQQVNQASSKSQAMSALNALLEKLSMLGFTTQESRIFLDLKLREREAEAETVSIAVVECAPETVGMMYSQLITLPNVEIFKYILGKIPSDGNFDPAADIIVVTEGHYEEFIEKLSPGRQIVRVAGSISTSTILDLAALPPKTRLGICCESRRLRNLIVKTCAQYCKLELPIKAVLFGDDVGFKNLIEERDCLVLPTDWEFFCKPEQIKMIRSFEEAHPANPHKPVIDFHVQIEQGSMLYLEDQVNKVFLGRQERKDG